MAAVGFDDFPGPCSDLALPPLFGGHILESELDQEVGFADPALHEGRGREEEEDVQDDEDEEEEEEEDEDEDEEEDEQQALGRRREAYRRKYRALLRRCKEFELVNEMLLNRLECVAKITQRLKQERRFLMKCLDSHGDCYRTAQLTILLEDEGSQGDDVQLGEPAQTGLPDGQDIQVTNTGPQDLGSPLPSAKRRKLKDERESQSQRQPSPFYILGHDQIKQECGDDELSPQEVGEPVAQAWRSGSPDRKTAYSEYPSPSSYPEFD
ncbi:TCF3 fusion partner isoform X2 [Stegostoma tigrinum]|uniref:TCF3 fusion partner isoform X2 n=1 Tax=Stegostoma tigrinum TaxID=3053191 RepID=UPI0028704C34|nr:TCF3 fusion partner isoform X2 [Stegostoma tigrinum]